jgi:hypothetical protein
VVVVVVVVVVVLTVVVVMVVVVCLESGDGTTGHLFISKRHPTSPNLTRELYFAAFLGPAD